MKKKILIDGMHCMKCVERIQNALHELGEVQASVDLENACATVESAQDISDKVLTDAIEDIGFDVRGIEA